MSYHISAFSPPNHLQVLLNDNNVVVTWVAPSNVETCNITYTITYNIKGITKHEGTTIDSFFIFNETPLPCSVAEITVTARNPSGDEQSVSAILETGKT